MKPLALATHAACLEHDAGPGHPERPERLEAVLQALRAPDLGVDLDWIQARLATDAELRLAHRDRLIREVEQACERGRARLDAGDTYVCSESMEAARRAAGAVLDACGRVLRGDHPAAFVAVRPPGHHAEESSALGFCLFNNVAIGARWLREQGVERVAIVDFDVHHGNGTQHLFESDANVFYASLHQFPHYPGTGARGERGIGEGLGTTLNCPLSAGTGDREWLAAMESDVLRELERFDPRFVLISAGFDAHVDDPLSQTRLSTQAFGEMTAMLCDLARRHAQGRVVSVLEGGYDTRALAASAAAHVKALARA